MMIIVPSCTALPLKAAVGNKCFAEGAALSTGGALLSSGGGREVKNK